MLLVLSAGEEQERELGQLLNSQHDKASPNYHRWLTPEEFGRRFGPSQDDILKVSDWLTQQGFVVHQAAGSGRWIEFSGTSGQVEHAFQTQMRNYQVEGSLGIANATEISLPAALAPVVKGVSLHGFFTRPHIGRYYTVRRNREGTFVPVDSQVTVTTTNGPLHLLTPSDYANIYDLNPLYQAGLDGSGQTIAIVARSNIEMADVETFREIFNLPVNDPKVILTGPDEEFFSNGDFPEATLDAEWAGALAPRATVDLVVSSSTATTDGVKLSAAYIVDNNLAPIMSVSFGACEQDLLSDNAFYNALWQQAAAQGISVFVSTGDDGAAGCDDPNAGVPASHGLAVNGLASTPFNTAVGGTQFAENGHDATFWNSANAAGFESATGYIPEAVWNESCNPASTTCPGNVLSLFSGSGGMSTLYAPPSWQTLNIPGLTGQSFSHRVLPDVSLAAAAGHDGYIVCLVGSCATTTDDNFLMQASIFGGTSASSPSMAAVMALINQKLGGRQGLANYALYQIATNESFNGCNSSSQTDPSTRSQCVFNDITGGNNGVPGQTGFNASLGFDEASGLGSINAASLATAWSALTLNASTTTLSATPTTVAHGQPISFSIAVAPGGGASGTPSGNVSLISDKFGPVGAAGLTGGTFGGSFSSLPGGQYNLVAHYPGDGTFGPSDSAAVPLNIGTEGSSLALSAFTNPSFNGSIVLGQFLALRGTVTSTSGQGLATGSVTFSDTFNGITTQLGSALLNAQGYAELVNFGFSGVPVNLSVGNHSISASYSGDSSFSSSTAASPLTVTVNRAILLCH
jgi:subtilase family serine protease